GRADDSHYHRRREIGQSIPARRCAGGRGRHRHGRQGGKPSVRGDQGAEEQVLAERRSQPRFFRLAGLAGCWSMRRFKSLATTPAITTADNAAARYFRLFLSFVALAARRTNCL